MDDMIRKIAGKAPGRDGIPTKVWKHVGDNHTYVIFMYTWKTYFRSNLVYIRFKIRDVYIENVDTFK